MTNVMVHIVPNITREDRTRTEGEVGEKKGKGERKKKRQKIGHKYKNASLKYSLRINKRNKKANPSKLEDQSNTKKVCQQHST